MKDLTADQIAWCKERMPAFALAYADVQRRDADVAANRAAFAKVEPEQPVAEESAAESNAVARGCFPPEGLVYIASRTQATAPSARRGYSTGPSAKIAPQHRGERA